MTAPSLLGLLGVVIFYAISVTPSLLPRRWWWHAFVSGILMGLGYVIGWGLEEAGKALLQVFKIQLLVPFAVEAWGKGLLITGVLLWALRSTWLSYHACQEEARMQETKPVGPAEYALGLVASFGMFALVMAIFYLLLEVFDALVAWLSNWIVQPIAVVLSLVAVIFLFLFVSNKVVFKFIMAIFARKAARLNTTSGGGYKQPTLSERSGSPESLSPWESIGGQGRKFLTKGPDGQRIAEVTGYPSLTPIRAYVGMPRENADLEALADLAVKELERTGAFDRAVVLVNTATGSGWVDEWLVQPMEYLTRGNCAVVTMQYSYLFSAAMMVSDLGDCARAGKYLLERVEKHVARMPPESRPLVIVSGESLGAYGSQHAFVDFDDATARVDGAIWTGPPHVSPLLRLATDAREPGSPEVSPVFEGGRHLRFVNEPAQLENDIFGHELGEWNYPRLVIALHASDPVVLYRTRTAFFEPDWLRERVGLDVSKGIRFTPLATFLQMVADLPVAGKAPAGHGHTYHRELIDVWMKVLGFDEPEARGGVGSTGWFTEEVKRSVGDAIDEDNLKDP